MVKLILKYNEIVIGHYGIKREYFNIPDKWVDRCYFYYELLDSIFQDCL